MQLFQQSEGTAVQRRLFFHAVDATDGITPETGLTGTGFVSENGATPVASASITEISATNMPGRYYVELTAGELSTLGNVEFRYKAGACAEVIARGQVVPYDPYDAIRMGLTALPGINAGDAGGLPDDTDVNGAVRIVDGTGPRELDTASGRIVVGSITGSAITAASIATAALDGKGDWNTVIPDAAGVAPTATEIRDAVTGGAYALDTDANGAIRIVDGTDPRELNLRDGGVHLADGAHGGPAAVITADRIIVASTVATEPAVKLTGSTTGAGLEANGGSTGGAGLEANGGGISGPAIKAANASGDCVTIAAGGGNGDGLAISGNGTGVSVSSPDGMFDLVKEIWDRILSGGTHNITNSAGRRLRLLEEAGTYERGAVYLDTVNGTAGAVPFENGTVLNPTDTIADALTLMASLNLNVLIVTAGSTITLAAAFENKIMSGTSYTLALGGQSITGSVFQGATVSGNDSGANATRAQFSGCEMGTSTLGKHLLSDCIVSGVITLAEGTDYEWASCVSDAGSTDPAVDFEAAAETKSLALRNYDGGIELRNHGAGGGTHSTVIGGRGEIIIAASCAGGTVTVAGHFEKSGSGTVTFSEVASFESIKDDGGGTYDREIDSLEEIRDVAGGGSADWSAGERENIRSALGVAGTKTTATAGQLQNVQARLPAALTAGRMVSDATAIAGSATAAAALSEVADTMSKGTVDNTAFTPTTTEFEASDITDADPDHWKDRNVVWTSGVLLGQMTEITAYTLTGGRGHFTVAAVTQAPANGETFRIV